VRETGVDSLAVSIGTSHGAYKFNGKSKLDLNRLNTISKLVKIPLVLHGASSVSKSQLMRLKKFGGNLEGAKGVSEAQITKAVKLGICKINMDTDLRIAFTLGVREKLQDPKEFDLRAYLSNGKEEMKKLISHKIKVLS
jgi:fructose-bisphosphate aldolase class II